MINARRIFKDEKTFSIVSQTWQVSWPMMLIMFIVFLIGLSDVFVAGKLGKEVQAAYGVAFQVYFIFSIVGSALTIGTVSVVSRLFTSENREDFIRSVDSSLLLSVISGVILGIIGFLSSGLVVALLRVPDAIKGITPTLVKIYISGILFNYVLLNTNALLRACKSIKKSLFSMLVVCLLNIVLNFYLGLHTPLGFRGIAWATVISTGIGSIINILFVKRFIRAGFSFSLALAKKILKISWPAGLLQIFWQTGLIVIFTILAAFTLHNVEIMAAFTNGLKIEAVIFLPAFAFNMACAVVVGNCLGKNQLQDAFRAGLITAFIGTLFVSLMTLAVLVNARLIASFLSQDNIVRQECVRYIYISLAFEPVMAWGVILAGGLNGAGDTMSVMKTVALSIWLVRIPLSYLLGLRFALGASAVWWSMNCSILVQSIFISRHYFKKNWLH